MSVTRERTRTRLTCKQYLDPFQELPQLLDPHLSKWLPVIAATFLEHLRARQRTRARRLDASKWLYSISFACCKLLYSFCKVRGEKAIVGFLNVETAHLEPLLALLEETDREVIPPQANDGGEPYRPQWSWEERYVVLLWLSQLFLAPFDLSTISSVDIDDEDAPTIPGFGWPSGVPGIAMRALPIATKYLASPGKERDAAKRLLVRLAMRRDMQELGITHALVQWALGCLQPKKDEPVQTPYHYIGILSLLAGMLISSSDASDMDKYLAPIFDTVHGITTNDDPMSQSVVSSAVARKMIIKVTRSIAVMVLRRPDLDEADTQLVETSISYLLERLSDADTPVRFAASKALAVVALKLDADMASQVIDAVLDSLNHNVLWTRDPAGGHGRDLTSVDPLEWHGLMLTLAHLLYRRSPPAGSLADVIHALLLGLTFERRSAAGTSTGTNVRDAACFGVWATARRYTSAELLAVPTSSLSVTGPRRADSSILQVLATELIVAASLDPAGNIRRGASAALQELIGRHPDTVEQGIWAVQAVDYHAVALRSRALSEVAMAATRLAGRYGIALLDALLGWRGIGDADSGARRVAARAFGAITSELATAGEAHPVSRVAETVEMVAARLAALQTRQVDERDGLWHTLAAVLDVLPGFLQGAAEPPTSSALQVVLQRSVGVLQTVLEECKTTDFRKPELVAEAAARLVVSFVPILQAAVLGPSSISTTSVPLLPGPQLIGPGANADAFVAVVSALDAVARGIPGDLTALLQYNIQQWLGRGEEEVQRSASAAALAVLVFSPRERKKETETDIESREGFIHRWADKVRVPPTARTGVGFGFFFALTMAHPVLPHIGGAEDEKADIICDALLQRWTSDQRVETHVALLQALTESEVLERNVGRFLPAIAQGLDDYTTTARGDIGSHVRLQALRATKSLWKSLGEAPNSENDERMKEIVTHLFLRVLRLASEKLDRVRVEAHATLAMALQPR
jgi:tubulin-specific chaperone D